MPFLREWTAISHRKPHFPSGDNGHESVKKKKKEQHNRLRIGALLVFDSLRMSPPSTGHHAWQPRTC